MALVPYVVEQTGAGERSMDIYSRLLSDRIIVLSDQVNCRSGDLRHDELYQVRCVHHLCGYGRQHGCVLAFQRRQGQAHSTAQQ